MLKDKFGLVLGKNIRYVDTSRLVHCHNKMVLIDGHGVLVSSQNWWNSAVSKNREAGVWLSHPGICGYFTGYFRERLEDRAQGAECHTGGNDRARNRFERGGFVRVSPADYQEV